VRRADVVRLAERLLGDLPVRTDDLLDVALDVAILQPPALEVAGQVSEPLVERRGRRVEVDEHEPAPRADARLG
jgi:hypothetical protein